MFDWQKFLPYLRKIATLTHPKVSEQKKMFDKNKGTEREAGGIILTKKKSTRELVAEAYESSEKVSWNTLQEREEGKLYWSGTLNTSNIIKEEAPDPTGAQWKKYCQDLLQKAERIQEKKTIVPTKPHRPIVKKDKENQPPRNTSKDPNKIIEDWIAKVEKEN